MKHPSVKYLFIAIILQALSGCNRNPAGNITETGVIPLIEPDYSGVTIPLNISPMNFRIKEPGDAFYAEISDGIKEPVKIRSGNGDIRIPSKKWKALLKTNTPKDLIINIFVKNKDEGWKKFSSITNKIIPEPIDPYLTFRLLYPGYESWSDLSIKQRSLEDFEEWNIIRNSVAGQNCVNCHSFNNGNTDDFLFHMRGSMGGTYFYSGNEFKKVNLKAPEMKNGAVYPRWHPSGKYIAFSSNKIIQQFHSSDNKKVEVTDLESSLVLYDVVKNEISPVIFQDIEKNMDTYPEWSPDGEYLYFCRAPQPGDSLDYSNIRYNLMRVRFDPENKSFGVPETVYDALQTMKSVSFPRISPDGKYLVMTLHNYGCFPIWHREADLWSVSLETGLAQPLSLNSDFTDSYHSWSSNSRWMVFSSKRDDGLTARPYIASVAADGTSGKAFILPQSDPRFYNGFLKTYNIPEFSQTRVGLTPGKIRRISKSDALQAIWKANDK